MLNEANRLLAVASYSTCIEHNRICGRCSLTFTNSDNITILSGVTPIMILQIDNNTEKVMLTCDIIPACLGEFHYLHTDSVTPARHTPGLHSKSARPSFCGRKDSLTEAETQDRAPDQREFL